MGGGGLLIFYVANVANVANVIQVHFCRICPEHVRIKWGGGRICLRI